MNRNDLSKRELAVAEKTAAQQTIGRWEHIKETVFEISGASVLSCGFCHRFNCNIDCPVKPFCRPYLDVFDAATTQLIASIDAILVKSKEVMDNAQKVIDDEST